MKIKVGEPDGTITEVEATIGPDVDLDVEQIYDSRGIRITEEYVRREVEHIEAGRGRPSLTGPGTHSPHVSFRVPAELRERAEARAAAEGKSLSALAREAFEKWLDAA